MEDTSENHWIHNWDEAIDFMESTRGPFNYDILKDDPTEELKQTDGLMKATTCFKRNFNEVVNGIQTLPSLLQKTLKKYN